MGHRSTSTKISIDWKEYPSLLQMKRFKIKAPHELPQEHKGEKLTVIDLELPLLCDESTAAEVEYVKYMFKTYVPAVNLRITFSQLLEDNMCTQGHKGEFGFNIPELLQGS